MISAATFRLWVSRFEGTIPHLYLDTLGLVTTAVGCLVDPVELALGLPFARPDGDPARADEIRADWQRVKAMAPGLFAPRYATADALTLTADGIAAVVAMRHDANVRALLRIFPDLDSYPEPAQLAMLGMAWAMGVGFPARFPRFSRAVRMRDWATAAEECRIRNANADRNDAHRDLLLTAVDA